MARGRIIAVVAGIGLLLGIGIAEAAGGAGAAGAAPRISIYQPSDGARFTGSEAKIIYEASAGVDRVEVLVDGEPVAVARGVERADDVSAAARKIVVPLPNRDVTVSLVAHAGGLAGAPATIRLVWAGPGINTFKPKLYAVVVGVSRYAETSLTLEYAAKDATDFAAALQAQSGGLYGDVQTKVLADGEATRRNIVSALLWLKRQVTANDVGIVYIAGHGQTDDVGNFWFIPVDASAEDVADQVAKDDILRPLRALAGRAILFIDACHAASTAGSRGVVDMDSVLNDFRAAAGERGIVTFSSSQGRGLSLERKDWGNGAFTKALVEGIAEGKAASSGGTITVSGLSHFVAERVKELTGGYQRPVTNQDNVADFPIALARPDPGTAPGSTGVAATAPPAVIPETSTVNIEVVFWQSIANSTRRDDFAAYLKKYPHGEFAELAESRLAALSLPNFGPAKASAPPVAEIPPAASPLLPPEVTAARAILIDYETGTVLFARDADTKLQPASLTKMMTAAVVFESIRSGKLKPSDKVTISENAWRKGGATSGGSTMFVTLNSSVAVEDLIRGLLVDSASDAAIALAEGIAGSEAAFAVKMNDLAGRIGLTSSHFTNPTGLTDPKQYATVRDLATLAAFIIREFPDAYKGFAEPGFTWNRIKQANRNPLLAMNIGGDGLTTGFAKESGYGIVGSAVRDGRRLIIAVSGANSSRDRDEDARRLLEWGFAGGKAIAASPEAGVEKRVAKLEPPAVEPAISDAQSHCDGGLVAAVGNAGVAAAAERCLKPKEAFRDCEHCPEMVVIPAGSFTMGSSDGEDGRDPDEGPQHEVTIARAFAVGKREVTVGEYAAFVEATGHASGNSCRFWNGSKSIEEWGRSWRNPGYAQADTHPVACISWEDAKDYVAWLVAQTGHGYRLLSEAEWEYAARGETRPGHYPRFHFGDDERDLCDFGNGADRSASFNWRNKNCNDGIGQLTTAGGRYRPNPFGLYDMLGNVWEWTDDCYHDSYRGAPNDGSVWISQDCEYRVRRGGAWTEPSWSLRAAERNNDGPYSRGLDDGFRVARTL